MNNNFSKISLLIVIILLVILCYIFYFLFNKVNANYLATKEMNSEISDKINSFNQLKILSDSLEKIKDKRLELEGHFIESSNLVPFLDTIEGLASTVGASAKTTSVDISREKTSLLVGLNAEGSFSSLYRFITLLENSPYEIEITSFDLYRDTSPEENTSTPGWNILLKIKLISFIN